ncbi:MAG: aldehyde dehydrogenase family protein [Bacteroidia bacterium]|nr:aldehyde dehydrogenase family protein [Bacteroidia bacterium]
MKIINPATEQILTEIEADSPRLIHNAYHSAVEAQSLWAHRSLKDRIKHIRNFDQLLEESKEDLAKTLTNEVGKPFWQSINEINGARGRIAYFLNNSERWLAEESIHKSEGLTEKISYEPLGVIGNISAWNYPYLVGVNVFVPALIAGNAVLYKASEYAALTGLKIEALMHEAGIPQHVFQTITGGAETGETLLTLPLDGYFFTGSHKTGQYIYEKVAKKMVPCQMELGGKDPLYVNADNTDIKAVAAAAAEGAFYNAGQSCCAVERIYVHELHYDDFVEAFVEEVKNMKVGNPMDKDTYIGPLTRESQVDFLQNQAGHALLKGARIIYGEDRWEGKGYYFLPTIMVDVDHSMRIMTEESFGPLIGVQKVSGDAEAIALMKDTDYGLTAAVYSDHYESAEAVLKAMRSGSVYWNCCDRVSANLPWSGRGNSGIGSTLSYQGIRAFVQPKAYHLRG